MNLNQVTLPSTDIRRSIDFYVALGFQLIVDSPLYARFVCPVGTATFSVHKVSSVANDSGTVIYFEHDELDQWVPALQQKGVIFTSEPADQSWLWRDARLNDPDGNRLCLYRAGKNRRFPPWRVSESD